MACSSSSVNVSTVAPSSDDYCGSSSSLLERLIDDAPDIFQREVLPKSCLSYDTARNATALALTEECQSKVQGVCRGCRTAHRRLLRRREVQQLAFLCVRRALRVGESQRHAPWILCVHPSTPLGRGRCGGFGKKAREHGCEWSEDAFNWAAESGNLEVLKYMHEEGCPWNEQWYEDYGYEESAIIKAVMSGNVEMVRWLRSVGAEWSGYEFEFAAAYGGVMLEFLWEQFQGGEALYFDPQDTLDKACAGGDVESLKWCLKHGCELSADCFECAAMSDSYSLDKIKILREDLCCPWDEVTCAGAAGSNRLDVLQWVRARGCPWDATTMMRAAERGRMDILKWAHANDAPWDKRVCASRLREWTA